MATPFGFSDVDGREQLGGFDLLFRVWWKFLIGQPHSAKNDLVGADVGRGLESCRTASSNPVVLIDAVAGDSDASDQFSVHEERDAAGKEDDSVLVGVGGLMALGAGVGYVELKEIPEWPRCRGFDA